jgi:hypothetical protein
MMVPLARWPYSPVSDVLHLDAGAYHFPKAIELYKTGTYGYYPFRTANIPTVSSRCCRFLSC